MKRVSESIKNVIFYLPQFFKALAFIKKNIPEFIGNGGKSFHTPLDSSTSKIKGTNHFFRTIIQSDGDIINIIPDIDTGLNKRYQERYLEHYDKVKRFCAELEGLSTITKTISALSGFALYRVLYDGIGLELKIYFCAMLWVLFSFLFHKFLSKYIFKLLINLVVKYVKVKAF